MAKRNSNTIMHKRGKRRKTEEDGQNSSDVVEHEESIISDACDAGDTPLIYGAENKTEGKLLVIQNVLVALAACIFLAGQFIHALHEYHSFTNGIAYLLGAGAYLMELLVLTDLFKRRHHWRELFMPYVFGALYIVLGVSYLLQTLDIL